MRRIFLSLACGPVLASALLAVWMLSLLVVPGCGYKTDLYRSDIRTVAVPILQSREFRRELEFRLSEALVKRIETDTPYKVVRREIADTILEGEVLEIRQNSYANDFRTELPRVRALTFVMSFRWVDLRTGELLVERKNFVQTITYVPPADETEYLATNEAIDQLAERLVEQLQKPW